MAQEVRSREPKRYINVSRFVGGVRCVLFLARGLFVGDEEDVKPAFRNVRSAGFFFLIWRGDVIISIAWLVEQSMDDERILEELLGLLEANGVAIRKEPLGGSGGGLCSVKGEQVFFVDTQAASVIVAAVCAEAAAKAVDVEKLYIRPEVREFIESNSNLERS